MKENKKRAGGMMVELIRTQRRKQQSRYINLRRLIACYEYGYKSSDRLSNKQSYLDDVILTFNAAQNAVDTVVSQVAAPNVSPMAITEGGTWTQRDQAEKLTHCLQGQFDEFDFDRCIKPDVIRDFALTGLGAVKLIGDYASGCLRAERPNVLDLTFDDAESRYGTPRCMYHTQLMDRYLVADMYGEADEDFEGGAQLRREKILKCAAAKADEWDAELSDSIIEVHEGWHLPSRAPNPSDPDDKGSGDGCHVIAIDGQVLLYEKWDWDRFPFAFFIAKRSRQGVWGIPVMRQLVSMQREFERIMIKLQKAHQRMGGAHILVNRAAKVATRQLTNDSGTVIEWEGTIPPQEWTPGAANAQTYQWAQQLPDMGLRFCGISPMSAQSQIPAGLQQASGKALQTFEDAENRRMIEWHRELERFTLDLADLTIRTCREMVANDVDVKTRYKSDKGFAQISWKEVLLDQEDFTLRIFPVNALSQTPSAKLQQASELLQMQAITKEDWRKLTDIPDLKAKNDLDLADEDIIDKNMDYMVRTGKYTQPEPFDNLQMIVQRAGKYYNLCRLQEVAESKLALIRQYAADAKALLDRQQQPAAPPGAPPMPPGGPGPMPNPSPGPAGSGGPSGGALMQPDTAPPMPAAA